MILVTGSTGGLGKETIQSLLKIIPAEQIVALARDPEKASAYKDAGITVKKGDYSDYESLQEAFKGIDRVLMISAPAFSDSSFDENAVRAATEAGVTYFVYTGFQQKKDSGWIVPGGTNRDLAMEKLLNASGLNFTIARNALYADAFTFLLGAEVTAKGVLLPSGNGRAAVATRADLGEALAKIITADQLQPKDITLSNSQNWSRDDIADFLTEITGNPLKVIDTSRQDYIAYMEKTGVPPFYAAFAADWADALEAGEFEETNSLLESLLGRKPTDFKAFLSAVYAPD